MLKCKCIFQIKYTEAILSNITWKLLWLKCRLQFKNNFIVLGLFIIILAQFRSIFWHHSWSQPITGFYPFVSHWESWWERSMLLFVVCRLLLRQLSLVVLIAAVMTSLCAASYGCCKRNTVCICCWAPCCGAVLLHAGAVLGTAGRRCHWAPCSACYRLILPAHRAPSSKLAACCYCGR